MLLYLHVPLFTLKASVAGLLMVPARAVDHGKVYSLYIRTLASSRSSSVYTLRCLMWRVCGCFKCCCSATQTGEHGRIISYTRPYPVAEQLTPPKHVHGLIWSTSARANCGIRQRQVLRTLHSRTLLSYGFSSEQVSLYPGISKIGLTDTGQKMYWNC
jgi:hypothetical protein